MSLRYSADFRRSRLAFFNFYSRYLSTFLEILLRSGENSALPSKKFYRTFIEHFDESFSSKLATLEPYIMQVSCKTPIERSTEPLKI